VDPKAFPSTVAQRLCQPYHNRRLVKKENSEQVMLSREETQRRTEGKIGGQT